MSNPTTSHLPADRCAGGIFIGKFIIAGLVVASVTMLLIAVWVALTS